jgi:hypothetical protein
MTDQAETIANLINTLRRIAAADPSIATLVVAEAREAIEAAEESAA